MKIKLCILILIVFLLRMSSYSQASEVRRTYHWYFGNRCGINFSSGSPVADTNSVINTGEGCATISDTCGKLLFYTDGITVWSSNHIQMPNGFGLHGDWSSQNSALIVPKPGNNNIYYIFTTPAYGGFTSHIKTFEYSIVDMTLNGGFGDITTKNVVLFSTATEMLGAIHHQNNIDYWVIAHKDSSNKFLAYQVTNNGVSNSPVTSNVGRIVPTTSGALWNAAVSGLKISLSGTRIAVTYPSSDTLEIYNFNNSTGALSNCISLNLPFPWSLCFSPNGNLLYVGSYDWSTMLEYFDQFDLSSNSQTGIMASRTNLSNILGHDETMQIGLDNKIYCTRNGNGFLAVVNSPNVAGIGCNFVANGVYLSGRTCLSGITNFVQSYLKNGQIQYGCSTVDISENSVDGSFRVFPNPFNDKLSIEATAPSNLYIYNLQGILTLERKLNSGQNEINTSELPSGIYYMLTKNGEHTWRGRFVKVE